MRSLNKDESFGELLEEVDKLFADMRFSEDSETYEFVKVEVQGADGQWYENPTWQVPDELKDFPTERIEFLADDLDEDTYGIYQYVQDEPPEGAPSGFKFGHHEITLSEQCLYDKITLAHELIHLHEHVLENLDLKWRDMLLVSLFGRLASRIPHLHELITCLMHDLNQGIISRTGGAHRPLFLLKSFDLDLKLGVELGTVFMYGIKDDIDAFKKTLKHHGLQ